MQATINQVDDLRQELKRLQDQERITFQAVANAIGTSRPTVSQFVNGGKRLKPELEAKAWDLVRQTITAQETAEKSLTEPQPIRRYKDQIELYETSEFVEAMGWCSYVFQKRKMGIMVGHPGSGKTTVLKAFAARTPGALYVEAWPTMRMGDLLEAIGRAAGIALRGNNYRKAQDIITALAIRKDIAILIDEAEYLRKWDVDKFEILRKLWDNTGTPVILSGTMELESMLTRGSGRDNLAQLYRRKVELKLTGIRESEAKAILKDYNVAPDVVNELATIAADVRHGGMGNFVEILDLCLESANGEQIGRDAVASAKKYKLMY